MLWSDVKTGTLALPHFVRGGRKAQGTFPPMDVLTSHSLFWSGLMPCLLHTFYLAKELGVKASPGIFGG